MSSPLGAYLPDWLTGVDSEAETRKKNYADMVAFLRRKGIEPHEIPRGLFERMQEYVQDGEPLYYQDPMRRFILWVGTGDPDPDAFLFFRG